MYNIQYDAARGCHAHKKLQQVLICINGQCSVLLDSGREKEEAILSKKQKEYTYLQKFGMRFTHVPQTQ
jgi:hypothetical protein